MLKKYKPEGVREMYEDPLKTGIDLSCVFCSRNVRRELIGDYEETVWFESVTCPSLCVSVIDCSYVRIVFT
jgi:hypothetical protein